MRAVSLLVGLASVGASSCVGQVDASRSTPKFVAGAPIFVGPMAGLPETGDFNGDGHLDLAVACGPCCGGDPSADAGHVQILLGDGAGGLRAATGPTPVGETALRVAVGDVDEDGKLDVLCSQHSSFDVTVCFGDGRGGLRTRADRPPVTLNEAGRPHVHSVKLVDVNHDDHLDLLATLVDDHALAVCLGDGTGRFVPATGQPYFAHRHPYEQLATHDLNGDGHLDVAMTDVRGNGVTVMVGSGTGMFASSRFRFAAHTAVEGAERPLALALGDLDGDGDQDMVATIDEAPQLVVLINQGNGRFRNHSANPVATPAPTMSLRLADFDGDGKLDVASGSARGTKLSLLFGRGDGSFSRGVSVDAGLEFCSIATGDFNGDGRIDLAASSYEEGRVVVLLNRAK